ncbi:hypothetical protein FXO38_18107 [Capsicum annuum]|uniref:F-box/LRR-repeat protein 15/At3g58940/PEG3-like LRR domain-containing protein n=1 Tax=Capsicum annuum TaxID=4072 RepID=A0A2G3AKE3_CAPAN|nr:hypothetical protein FXO38_18107 [Capsicum annuum]KAF3685415.1 hypothetical protein FXO37_00652 [Capsicum annuum]PHT94692.1 hypothetical protein T459_02574 [Capsicum annuum]
MLPLIHAAASRNVQKLVLWFWLHEPFELPGCLVTCESLQALKLNLCGDVLKLPNHLGFRQLKLLHLESAELPNEHFTSCLFSKCDVLEKLVLVHCNLAYMTTLY